MRLCLMFICLMLASAAGAKPDEVTMSLNDFQTLREE